MPSPRADDQAALVFDELASAFDAGLPLTSLGADPSLEEQTLLGLCEARGVTATPTERIVFEAAWRGGSAPQCLRQRAVARRRRADFAREVWRQLSYPLLLGALLPLAAACTASLIGWGFAIGLVSAYAVVATMLVMLRIGSRRGHPLAERLLRLGGLRRDLQTLPYLEALAALYSAGVPIVTAHRDAVATVPDGDLRRRLERVQRELDQGQPLREAIAIADALDPETRTLLANGDVAGDLEPALGRAAQRRADVAVRRLGLLARIIGRTTYILAAVGVVWIVFRFYSGYLGALRHL